MYLEFLFTTITFQSKLSDKILLLKLSFKKAQESNNGSKT